MKATSLKTAAVMAASLGLLAGSAMAQGTAVSGVVGYETLVQDPGTVGYIGIRLHESAVVSGTLNTVGTDAVQDTDGVDFSTLLAGGATYILEINDGSGILLTITDADVVGTDTINTSPLDLSAEGVANDAAYTIRPAGTLASVFGENNEIGLAPSLSFATADQLWIPNIFGGFDKYYYAPALGPIAAGWKDEAGTLITAADIDLVYTDGYLINSTSGNDLVISGAVKTANTSIALTPGVNYVGSVYPVGANIETTFGAENSAGLDASLSFATADQIWIPAAGGFDKYYYAPALGPIAAGWKDEGGTLIDAASIPVPSGYLINNAGDAQNVDTTPPSYYSDL